MTAEVAAQPVPGQDELLDGTALQLIGEFWKKVGIRMLTKPQTVDNFRLRAFSGEAIMTAFAGFLK